MDPASDHHKLPRFDDRLLAETAAVWEQLEPFAADDRQANLEARDFEGDFELRLVERARLLPIASTLADALRHVRGAISLVVFLAIIAALLAGAATARAALGTPRDEPVNIFHVLAATLGPQTILLALWIGVMFKRHSASGMLSIVSLGGLAVRAGQWLARRVHPGRAYASAVAGCSRTFLRGSVGRWTFSSISHALWLSFNISCLSMLVFLLSTRQYSFAWETTILSAESYEPLTRAIASVPRAAGFLTPSDDQIAAGRWNGTTPPPFDASASQAWSALLVGSLVVYGIAPRLLLLGLSLGRARAARRRYRLDTARPEFARWRDVLEPTVHSMGVVDPSPQSLPTGLGVAAAHQTAAKASSRKAGGLPAVIGYELPPSLHANAWPPAIHGTRWHDLGMVDSRDDRRRVLSELAQATQEPASLVIVCSLTTTPDRGVGSFLAELAAAVSIPPLLVLTGGQRLRDRQAQNASGMPAIASTIESRLADWHAMAASAGIVRSRVLELDLEHLTRASQSRLAALLATGHLSASASHEPRFDLACSRIIAFADERSNDSRQVDAAAQATLHAEIARLYGDAPPRWRTLLHLPSDAAALAPASLASRLSASAERLSAMLPDRLKRSPRWLAAGATAGALGCVAAAALISPVAIGALPIWSGLGAAIAAVTQPGRSVKPDASPNDSPDDGSLDRVVRSAALFAMLLELQGFDERIITRVLDVTVTDADADDPAQHMRDAAEVERWLDELRHRFDLALAQEVRS